jgi:hypothetical protein
LLPDPIFERITSPDKAGTLAYRISIRKGTLIENPDLLHDGDEFKKKAIAHY